MAGRGIGAGGGGEVVVGGSQEHQLRSWGGEASRAELDELKAIERLL